jgi:hypothetical protein
LRATATVVLLSEPDEALYAALGGDHRLLAAAGEASARVESGSVSAAALIGNLRARLHRVLIEQLTEVRTNKFAATAGSLAAGHICYSMADSDNELSIALAALMVDAMMRRRRWKPTAVGDKSGRAFQKVVAGFVGDVLGRINLGPLASFHVIVPVQRGKVDRRLPTEGDPRSTSTIANFEAYAHLLAIDTLIQADGRIRAAFGGDYFVRPDVLVWRRPLTVAEVNQSGLLLDSAALAATRSSALADGGGGNVLHASISCKWTMRSDRAQNSRTEAANLMRNRKGRVPHITAVIMEPLPSRIASIAQGTGDIDCTYHCALGELRRAMDQVLAAHRSPALESEARILDALIEGRRLRDVADLPFDLLL